MKTPVTIRFVSGREERYEVEIREGSRTKTRLQAFVENPNLLLRMADEVLIIPGSAIECISIQIPEGDERFDLTEIRPAARIE